MDALLSGEISFVRLVCRQFQNLRISERLPIYYRARVIRKAGSPRKSAKLDGTLQRLFGADAAADPGQFIHERIRKRALISYRAGTR